MGRTEGRHPNRPPPNRLSGHRNPPPQVKRWYMKANLVVHPDKVKQKGGTLEQARTAACWGWGGGWGVEGSVRPSLSWGVVAHMRHARSPLNAPTCLRPWRR